MVIGNGVPLPNRFEWEGVQRALLHQQHFTISTGIATPSHWSLVRQGGSPGVDISGGVGTGNVAPLPPPASFSPRQEFELVLPPPLGPPENFIMEKNFGMLIYNII